ncbi:carbohydrate kinase family protein [Nonomuraea soli]|uniref:Fructokinase n=1 Tax=Nonomuraea soli TaxID=1032476 RepID=A0A7W0CPP1_9ACTN|nr:carbohydrate kinase [Nonomuraea soli]MBA2895036.1 fructokinase [Nonomuraea soli]
MTATVTVIGEAVADAFATPGPGRLDLRVRPGGGPLNTAVALARLGTPTRYLGRLAGGVAGDLLRDHLLGSGVDLSQVVEASEQASLAIAALDACGSASYSFYVDGTADWAWTADELSARVPYESLCLHGGSLTLALAPQVEELFTLARPHATISVDPNVRPSIVPAARYLAALPRWAAFADLIRVSEEDLDHLGLTARQACERWHEQGVRLVVVTLGARGARASLDGTEIEVPAPVIDVVDTVGAGDTFTAGLLHALAASGELGGRLDGLTPEIVKRALELGVRAAARTCEVPGADPPWAVGLR